MSTFSDFIEQQIALPTATVDWGQQREEWLQHLSHFYQLVEAFMREYVEQGKVSLHRATKTLHEEYIGDYSVDTLALYIGPNKIEFDPIGTNLIGAKGRVDMRSAKGTVKFVLVPEDATTTVPRVRSLRVLMRCRKPLRQRTIGRGRSPRRRLEFVAWNCARNPSKTRSWKWSMAKRSRLVFSHQHLNIE